MSLTTQDLAGFGRWYTAYVARTTGKPASPKTLQSKVSYIRGAERHLSSGTWPSGEPALVLLAESLTNRQAVMGLLNHWSARLKATSVKNGCQALISFCGYAEAMDWMGKDTSALLMTDLPPKSPPKPITVYSREEMEKFVLFSRAYGLHWWAFVSFIAETGRRVGEALSLEWDWFRRGVPRPYFELPSSKNGDPQYVPLTRFLANEVFTPENIEALKNEHSRASRDPAVYVFPWQYSNARRRFERMCKAAGLPQRGFHNFRHTVITERIAAGMPIQAVASLAGHRSVQTTLGRYNHVTALHFASLLDDGEAV